MKILLADGHALARKKLVLTLRRLGANTEIVETGDYHAALRIAKRDADVDLALLDIATLGMDEFQSLGRLRERLQSAPPIVIWSASEDPHVVRDALLCGAQGYIPKSSTSSVILGALQLIFSGGIYLPPSLLYPPMPPHHATSSQQNGDDGLDLTQRQREVLALIIKGNPNKEIARVLNIAEPTVRTHATAIFKILHVSNRTQAGHVAAQRGFCLSHRNARRYIG